MGKTKTLSNIELVNKGWLFVNIPSIAIILCIWFGLTAYVEWNGKISAIIGGIAGWVYWEYAIKKWIKWALDNNVEPVRLLKAGRLSLLLWNSRQIDKVLNDKK